MSMMLTLGGIGDPEGGGHAGEDGGVAGQGGRQARGTVPHWGAHILQRELKNLIYF